jgi:hypothetical protein
VNWDKWSVCNATCDGKNASVPGTKTRTYTVKTPASNGGIICPISPETETCIKTDCIVPLGTGIITGNITTTLNSTDKYMIFTTNPNTFTVPSGGLNCDILMIGGGGSGGQYGGGGSGACIIAINQTLPSGVCSVVVGSAGTTSSIAGNSSITINNTNIRYLAIGGGRGGNTNLDGENGGCGGGAGSSSGATREGGTTLNTNIVNGTQNISPTGPTTSGINYAVLGNVGGKQLDTTGSNSRFSASGGGGIGSPGVSHNNGKGASGGGGSGLNEVTAT